MRTLQIVLWCVFVAGLPICAQSKALPAAELSDGERAALTFTAYDLDVRLTPATSHIAGRARVTVRNDSAVPLSRLALQVSSTLTWESVTLVGAGGTRAKLPLAQHLLDTDADHTGKANEAIVSLAAPLAAGATVSLDTFYSGTLAESADRLVRLGAGAAQASASDWDAVDENGIFLRGFGNVLWYPVAAPQAFLGDGGALFALIGQTKLRESAATVRLRVGVEYAHEPPVAAFFGGRGAAFRALSDDSEAQSASGGGIATAEFAAAPLGFRALNLFITGQPEHLIAASKEAGSSSSSSAAPAREAEARATPGGDGSTVLAVVRSEEGSLPRLEAEVRDVTPLLQQWFGAAPATPLTLIDHAGQPFQDGPVLLAPAASLAGSDAGGALAFSLTHAWVRTDQPWMDEGLAQFAALLWTEREQGRPAANAQLGALLRPLAAPDPALGGSAAAGEPLAAATDELYFRRKAGAVWWMLRNVAGDEPLRLAIGAFLRRPASQAPAREQAQAFQKLLEQTSGKDLAWFFNDWVYRDAGLPDLSITDITPRQLPAGPGHDSGWLVAVTVHNAGGAVAEVPVVVRAGNGGASFSKTQVLRVPGGGDATARVLVEAAPTEVLVNDGSTPEVHASVHQRTVLQRAR